MLLCANKGVLIKKMRTEREIKKRIMYAQGQTWAAKKRDDDAGIRAWVKTEKHLKWVLENSEDEKDEN